VEPAGTSGTPSSRTGRQRPLVPYSRDSWRALRLGPRRCPCSRSRIAAGTFGQQCQGCPECDASIALTGASAPSARPGLPRGDQPIEVLDIYQHPAQQPVCATPPAVRPEWHRDARQHPGANQVAHVPGLQGEVAGGPVEVQQACTEWGDGPCSGLHVSDRTTTGRRDRGFCGGFRPRPRVLQTPVRFRGGGPYVGARPVGGADGSRQLEGAWASVPTAARPPDVGHWPRHPSAAPAPARSCLRVARKPGGLARVPEERVEAVSVPG
jgi:hypothetical protein